MPTNFYELVCIFIIYAFIGWCTEVAYAALNTGKFVNRGFLNGPYCPIYGCGVVVVVACLTPLKDNIIVLFIGSFLLTTIIEFFTGLVLEKIFHNKWWDYSDLPFNIKGYICLKFSIYWGIACTFVMKIVHPIIYKFITLIPFVLGVVLVTVIMIVFVVDICLTVAAIKKLNEKIRVLDEMAQKIHSISDAIGENIYEGVNETLENTKETREKLEKEHQELSAKYKELLEKKTLGAKRLLKAFPTMKPSAKFENRLNSFIKYKEQLLTKKKERREKND